MQPSIFWRELKTEFQNLRDPVWQNRSSRERLQAWGSEVVGADASVRAHFRQLAKRGGVALGAVPDDALDAWLTALRSYLKQEKIPWLKLFESSTWTAGPTERRELELSFICPQKTRLSGSEYRRKLLDLAESIRHGGLPELLIVVGDAQAYLVLDDDREHLKYWACVEAGVSSVTCGIRDAADIGTTHIEPTLEIDCVSEGSVQLCTALETEALAGPVQHQNPQTGGLVPHAESSKPAAESERRSATWKDVRIEFTSEARIQVTVVGQTSTLNFAEMGFENRTTKNPNKAWATLKQFAESGGSITTPPRGGWHKMEKRAQEIRKTLRAHFAAQGFDIPPTSDPLPFVKGGGYQARFSLGVRPSYSS